jgi:hypothetical protein
MQTITELADQLTPFWQRDLDALRAELSGTFAVAGGGGGTESVSRHDFLGAYHELPTVSAGAVLIGPELSSGLPAFRSLTITDINAALASRSVGAGSGISGGGNLGSNISIAVDQGYSFVWTAAHTFNSAPTFMTGATVQGTSPIVFGGGLADTLAMARTSAVTMTLVGSSGASVFEASIVRGVGTASGFTLDDRILNDGVTSRWFLHVNSGIWQWKYGPSAATTVLNLDRFGSMRSPNYVSQTTGANVDFGVGSGDFRYLFTDEMHAKSFIADLEQALAGGQIITRSVTILARNFTAPAASASTTLTVEDLPSAAGMQVFVNGDFVGVRNFNRAGGMLDVSYAWGTVTLDTTYTRTLTTTATGGTLTLTSTTTTAAIAFNAATTAVQSALEALASIGVGNVSVTGSPGAWVIRFIGSLADSSVPLSVNGAGLTGGTATLTPSGYDSTTKSQRYTFTRSATADAGYMTAGTVIAADAIILDFGTPGNGIAEVTAVDGLNGINSPYYRIATFATHPRLMTERTRMGNLRGITGVANEFGLWAGNSIAGATLNGTINSSVTTITVDDTSGFPTAGEIVIETERITYTGKTGTQFTGCVRGANGTAAAAHTNGERVNECGVNAGKSWMRMSTQAFALNNLDFEIWRAGTRRFRVDSATPYLALGSPNPTSYLGATGFFVGDNGSGVYRLHVGSTSAGTLTAGMSWDGSTLNVIGAINAVSGTFSGVVTVGASGGIYQGTGTFASPTTGLKIWNDSGVGRIAGFGSGTLQWSSDTTGRIIAGGGNVYLDNSGLNFALPAAGAGAQDSQQSIDFVSGGSVRASIFGSYQTLNGLRIRTTNEFGGGEPVISLLANSATVVAEIIVDPGIRALGGSEIQLKRRVEVWERMDVNIQGLYTGDALVVGSNSYLQGALRVGTPYTTSTVSGTIRAGNNAHFGNASTHDSNPTSANWGNADNESPTLLLNGANYTAIGFHDGGSRVDFIRAGGGTIVIGHPVSPWNAPNVGIGGAPSHRLDVHGSARVQGTLLIDGDGGGVASTVGITDVTSDWNNITLGNGQVKMLGDTNRNSKGWLKIYVGTTIRYIPYWETITG